MPDLTSLLLIFCKSLRFFAIFMGKRGKKGENLKNLFFSLVSHSIMNISSKLQNQCITFR